MKKSISTRFSTAVVIVSVLILLFIIGINFLFNKQQLEEMANTKAKLEICKSQKKINKILFGVMHACDSAHEKLPKKAFEKNNIEAVLRDTLKKNSDIYGMTVAIEPGEVYNSLFAPYYYKKANKIIYANLATDSYNYRKQPWYTDVKTSRVATWSEPYFDQGGGETLMATYSNPLFYKGEFAGVITTDFSLKKLSDIISSIHILKTGYAFLLSKEHKVLVHPNHSLIMKQYEDKDIVLNKFIKDKKSWKFYVKIESTGWLLGIVLPKKELFSSLYKLMIISILLAILGIIGLIIITFVISNKITKPLKEVIQKSVDISNGNFEEHIKQPKVQDEIYQLSSAINKMQDDIKSYIDNLKIATQKEQKRKSELDIANRIQMSMLPSLDEMSHTKQILLYADLVPAKEVGGDFYDFFNLGEDKFCFVVADVSGKGVPAALFMAVAISYIRAYSTDDLTPNQIIQKVNDALSYNNEANMFVTLFFGILDLKSNKLSYVNAGHPQPFLMKKTNEILYLPSKNDPVIGVMEGIEFQTLHLTLHQEERLFIYTDGVNEAFSKEDEQFGQKRIVEMLEQMQDVETVNILQDVKYAVDNFCTGVAQSDDITMMVLELHS